MDTVLRSRSGSVTIGAEQPFCVIGERINPTGRKKFAEELRGRQSRHSDRRRAGPGQRRRQHARRQRRNPDGRRARAAQSMLRAVQDAVDVPICIDSSVIEALRGRPLGLRGPRAGQLGHRRGRAPGGDPAPRRPPRRGRDRPGQRRDGNPRDPPEAAGMRAQDRQRRQRPRDRHRRRDHRPAGHDRRRRHRGRHHHPGHDLADPRRARRQHVPRRLQRLLRPAPAPRAQRRLSAHGDGRRPDQRDHVHRRGLRPGGARRRPAARPRPLGLELDRRPPRPRPAAAAGGRRPQHERVLAQAAPRRARDRARARGRGAADPPALPARRRRGPGPERHPDLRRRELERDRHRLDLWRSRHLQEVQGPHRLGRRADVKRRSARLHHRRSCATAGGWPAGPTPAKTSWSRSRRCRPGPRRRWSGSAAT